jgi:hypothetical protein
VSCGVRVKFELCAKYLKNETLRILLVTLCFGYVNVNGYVPLQRVAAGISTDVFLFCLLQWLFR